jgi:hypothetical protein
MNDTPQPFAVSYRRPGTHQFVTASIPALDMDYALKDYTSPEELAQLKDLEKQAANLCKLKGETSPSAVAAAHKALRDSIPAADLTHDKLEELARALPSKQEVAAEKNSLIRKSHQRLAEQGNPLCKAIVARVVPRFEELLTEVEAHERTTHELLNIPYEWPGIPVNAVRMALNNMKARIKGNWSIDGDWRPSNCLRPYFDVEVLKA